MEVDVLEGEGRADPEGRSPSREISRGVVAIYKDHLGRGPTSARTKIADDMVITVLEDSLTKAERKLQESNKETMVRQIRREFQDAMRNEIKALVEKTLDREVFCMLSDHSPNPDYAVELLILAPSRD